MPCPIYRPVKVPQPEHYGRLACGRPLRVGDEVGVGYENEFTSYEKKAPSRCLVNRAIQDGRRTATICDLRR